VQSPPTWRWALPDLGEQYLINAVICLTLESCIFGDDTEGKNESFSLKIPDGLKINTI